VKQAGKARPASADLDSFIRFIRVVVIVLVIYGAPMVSAAATTIFVVPFLFFDLQKDTNALSNTVLAFIAGLAVLAFTYAQTVNDDLPSRRRLLIAGEIFVGAALLLVFATVFKYTLVEMKWDGLKDEATAQTYKEVLSGAASFFFIVSALAAHVGAGMVLTTILYRWGWVHPSPS
jgi:hypothetical protein